jgi:hypothetical protein
MLSGSYCSFTHLQALSILANVRAGGAKADAARARARRVLVAFRRRLRACAASALSMLAPRLAPPSPPHAPPPPPPLHPLARPSPRNYPHAPAHKSTSTAAPASPSPLPSARSAPHRSMQFNPINLFNANANALAATLGLPGSDRGGGVQLTLPVFARLYAVSRCGPSLLHHLQAIQCETMQTVVLVPAGVDPLQAVVHARMAFQLAPRHAHTLLHAHAEGGAAEPQANAAAAGTAAAAPRDARQERTGSSSAGARRPSTHRVRTAGEFAGVSAVAADESNSNSASNALVAHARRVRAQVESTVQQRAASAFAMWETQLHAKRRERERQHETAHAKTQGLVVEELSLPLAVDERHAPEEQAYAERAAEKREAAAVRQRMLDTALLALCPLPAQCGAANLGGASDSDTRLWDVHPHVQLHRPSSAATSATASASAMASPLALSVSSSTAQLFCGAAPASSVDWLSALCLRLEALQQARLVFRARVTEFLLSPKCVLLKAMFEHAAAAMGEDNAASLLRAAQAIGAVSAVPPAAAGEEAMPDVDLLSPGPEAPLSSSRSAGDRDRAPLHSRRLLFSEKVALARAAAVELEARVMPLIRAERGGTGSGWPAHDPAAASVAAPQAPAHNHPGAAAAAAGNLSVEAISCAAAMDACRAAAIVASSTPSSAEDVCLSLLVIINQRMVLTAAAEAAAAAAAAAATSSGLASASGATTTAAPAVGVPLSGVGGPGAQATKDARPGASGARANRRDDEEFGLSIEVPSDLSLVLFVNLSCSLARPLR